MTKRKKSTKPAASNKTPRLDVPEAKTTAYEGVLGYIDPTTGQRGAFPGLLPTANDDFYGPAIDGFDYLRMVRSEARHVPSLLVSASAPPPPREKPYHNPDDVVLSYDEPEPEQEHASPEPEDPMCKFGDSAFYSLHPSAPDRALPAQHTALLRRFTELRTRLHANPPEKQQVELPRKFAPKWLHANVPTPALVWAMEQEQVLRCVECLGKVVGTGTRTVRRGVDRRIAEWAWALLVRVDEVMGCDEVWRVREVGKVAGRVRDRVVEEVRRERAEEEEVRGLEEEIRAAAAEEASEDGEEGELEEEEEAGELMPEGEGLVEDHDRIETLAALDMIISIIGGFFGQKDLLEERYAGQ